MTNNPKPKLPSHDLRYNLLTAGVILLTLVCVIGTIAIFIDPALPINPMPPSGRQRLTQDASLFTPTPPLETKDVLEPSPADTITPFSTVQSTFPSTPFITIVIPTAPLTTSTTPTSAFPFLLSKAGVRASVAFQGCAWQGVAGQIFDPLGVPIPNLQVHLEGKLDGRPLSLDANTSSLPVYGDGAYEIPLGETPVPSENAIWIQLLDHMKKPLSDRISLKTYEGCDRNLILVDFQQVTP